MSKTSYTITVHNRSGSKHQYILYSHTPQINQPTQNVKSLVISSTTVPASEKATLKFMSRYYQAFCGTMSMSRPTKVTPTDYRAISLGNREKAAGTTLNLATSHKPGFQRTSPGPSASQGAFEIVTGETVSDNLVIGYGVYTKATPRSQPAFSFTPDTDTTYSIKPSNIYYIACCPLEAGSIVDPSKVSLVCKIDFDSRGTSLNVDIVHDNDLYLV